MTKKEMLDFIKTEMSDNAEVVDFCEHEIKLIERRAARKSSQPSKRQIENISYKEAIYNFLTESECPMTVSEIIANCNEVNGLSVSKVSALLTQMKKDNQVTRTEIHKKAFFSVSNVEVAA